MKNKMKKENNIQQELSKYNVIAYWWNMRSKKLDFSGNLYDLLISKGIKVKKVIDKKNPNLDCYVFTNSHRVTFKNFGSAYDGAWTALKLWYATMGDKAIVIMHGRIFTINF